MASEWYYSRKGQKEGPTTFKQLQRLADSGQLRATDLVWHEGMADWSQAAQVADLFPKAGPPPVPVTPATVVPAEAGARTDLQQLWQRLWANKLLFFSLCLLVSLVCTCTVPGLFGSRKEQGFMGEYEVPTAMSHFAQVAFILADLGLLVTVGVLGLLTYGRKMEKVQRRFFLHGHRGNKWEPVNGMGCSLYFYPDGGFMRSDGFGAKYAYDPATDLVTVSVAGFDTPIPLKLLSVTKDELVLAAQDQALHYRRAATITEERWQESSERTKEFLKTAAVVAGKAAVVTVGMAALGVLVLGAAAVAVGGAAGSVEGSGFGPASSPPPGGDRLPARDTTAETGTVVRSELPKRQRRVVGLCGVVIVQDDGSFVTWRKKCEKCGHVEPGTSRFAHTSGILSGSFRCSKCGNMQDTKIEAV
jgi:hypothetical protein